MGTNDFEPSRAIGLGYKRGVTLWFCFPVSACKFLDLVPALDIEYLRGNKMEPQWQQHLDTAANRHGRYSQPTSQQPSREPSSSSGPHQPPPSGFSYETYQTPSVPSHPHSIATSPIGTPHARQYNNGGDVAMEDADPYNRMKYPSRPNHQQRASGQYLSQEDSAAARRYSPMKALSPSSPYAATPHQPGQPLYTSYPSQNASARQSPTRPSMYSSQSQSYYSSPSKFVVGYGIQNACLYLRRDLIFFSIDEAAAVTVAADPTRRHQSRPVLSIISNGAVECRFRSGGQIAKKSAPSTISRHC